MSGSNPNSSNFTNTITKRTRKEASLSPSEQEVNQKLKKRPAEIGTMDIEKISQLLDVKLQPIKDSLDIVSDLVRKNVQMESRLEEQDKKISELQKEIEFLRLAATSKNLIFKNITCEKDVNPAECIKNVCKNILNVPDNIEVENAYYIGKSQKNILVEFRSRNSIRSVLSSTKKLQGSGIRIDKDYPKAIRIKNNKLLAIRRELRRINKNHTVTVRNGVMLFQNQKFEWDSNKGLLLDDRDGVQYLKEKFNVDVSNIAEKLAKEDNARVQPFQE